MYTDNPINIFLCKYYEEILTRFFVFMNFVFSMLACGSYILKEFLKILNFFWYCTVNFYNYIDLYLYLILKDC